MEYDTEIGEGILWVWDGLYHKLVNTETGRERVMVSHKGELLVDDRDVDFEAIERAYGEGAGRDKMVSYEFKHYTYKNGICALVWVIYPDGMWFADEDGFGMEDNNEEVAYCIINRDFEILMPFRPVKDIEKVMDEFRGQ